MIRVIVLYEGEVDPERYQRHIDEFVTPMGATFRHGPVFGSPIGQLRLGHFAEFEFPDRDSFDQTVRSPAFAAAGEDAASMGIPFSVHFVDLG